MCPLVLADCISRLAVGSGLPADGHAAHSMVAALAKFAWMGAPGKMKTALGMVQSECLWDLAAGRLNTLMVGASASGKDCATDVARRLVERLQESERIVFSSVVSQGSITLAGCLRKLKKAWQVLGLHTARARKTGMQTKGTISPGVGSHRSVGPWSCWKAHVSGYKMRAATRACALRSSACDLLERTQL